METLLHPARGRWVNHIPVEAPTEGEVEVFRKPIPVIYLSFVSSGT